MKKIRNNGITLIALVITIIILLILAGISISAVTGSGLFQKAEEAVNRYGNAQNKELNELDKVFSSILIAEDSKVTLTMKELDDYINNKVEEKMKEVDSKIASMQQKYASMETSIKNITYNKITYTYELLAKTTSKDKIAVDFNEKNLSDYKYVMLALKHYSSGAMNYGGMIPVELFREIPELWTVQEQGIASSVSYINDTSCQMYAIPSGCEAILYGIK